ncbi:MAG: phosphodiester glycosidase family protein [Candidatus Kerfeldbacteria bacterium]|nr:phosphodiester glycosidase family protein [Candidatus Kerfeldbacteria bacterium]
MKRALLTVGLLFSLAGCSSSWTIDLSNVNSANNPVIQPTVQYPTWTAVRSGIDFKQQLVEAGDNTELLSIVRIDPTLVELTIAVDEAIPQTVSHWQEELAATVVINGSYFDEDYALVTRTVMEGEPYGPLLSGHTGSFTKNHGRWTITNDASALGDSGIQSYPILVLDGTAQVNTASTDTGQRTVVALDQSGRVYLIICEYGVFTLTELAAALAELSDPALVSALNFDGGTSTGLSIQSDTVRYLDDSLVVPSVVAIP